MAEQKFSVNQYPLSVLLGFIDANMIAIPEIQRPFVWEPTKVRDLIDSLFEGYPIGYLIVWQNPDIKLKNGQVSMGKKILIDGQQRITALMAAVRGMEIVTKTYLKRNITIAFNPLNIGNDSANVFEVLNPAIEKDKKWFNDISQIINSTASTSKIIRDYCELNEIYDQSEKDSIDDKIHTLKAIVNIPIGVIDLSPNLDIQTVTDIFIRINSQGQELSQADFAMSKIAANETYGGNTLRKCIDYFCHLAIEPNFYEEIKNNDKEFANTEYFSKMAWLKKENDDIYDPQYTDMLRVAFTSEFKRGRLQDLVALLSGRDFEKRTYEEEIAERSFEKLKKGILNFMSEYEFKHFVSIIRSAGFIDASMIRSQNALNFAYILYLVCRNSKLDYNKIEKLVRRWYVFSVISGRYAGSPESVFDLDIRRIDEIGIEEYINSNIKATLSQSYWEEVLPMRMNTSVSSSPLFKVYLAAHVYNNDKGFLSKDIKAYNLINGTGNIHHVFPRAYLKKCGLERDKYNQIANYVIMQDNINVSVGDDSPDVYMKALFDSVHKNETKYGNISDLNTLEENLAVHCIPKGIEEMFFENYEEFLEKRRKLMAKKIRQYYECL